MAEKNDIYNFADDDSGEPAKDSSESSAASGDSGSESEAVWEPILVEGEDATECPNCGAPMPGEDEVVCIRCGFDLAQMRPLRVQTGEVVVDEAGEVVPPEGGPVPEVAPPVPLCRPGLGGLPLPAAVAGVCLLVMVIAYFAASPGLFRSHEGRFARADWEQFENKNHQFTEPSPLWRHRIARAGRHVLIVLIMGGTTFGALALLGLVEGRPVGETNLALLRSLAIIAVCSTMLLISLPEWLYVGEQLLQLVLMAGVFLVLARLFFNLDWRNAMMLGGASTGILLVLMLISLLFGSLLG